ncbi:enoyl-CoA hydratase/isomerase family protein [Candidatus Deferrimicrobium sp.]|uniref:enoyl-CoA hydratase/isomerase family protein n=1 Tax=Candidatus Deferrimicrobium sp. TaxID=3060586 RepID=UPI002721770C|nr:enoyl-CoA hydratase-related protein [Candidatus Deferrimicrobium sp.]MDO8738837.1 enoyl-CoA hydratase-related protein [Candidatus Deferrimicrobium sp.]
MEFTTLLFEVDENIAWITFNRPKVLNAFNTEMLRDCIRALEYCRDSSEVRVVVFRGAGEKAFSAGADISEIQGNDPFRQRDYNLLWIEFFRFIENIRKPMIASVHGYAPGGGTELTLCCDIVLACDDAKFALAEIKIGVIPGAGATIRLPRWVGKAKAMEILMTGDFVEAAEAHRIGLINQVVPRQELAQTTLAMARKIAQRPPLALAAAKAAVNIGAEMDRDRGIDYALCEFLLLFASEDQKEGMRAFIEKRAPNFTGR